MFFEKLIDLIIKGWDLLTPCFVIDAYQGAAVLRLGKLHRAVGPGLHWKWPITETYIDNVTCITTLRLAPQTLTTKDDITVVVGAIVKYQINDIGKYVTTIYDQADALTDMSMGAIRIAVGAQTYK